MAEPIRPIQDVAAELGVDRGCVTPFGSHKVKLDPRVALGSVPSASPLVLVSAIGPTRAGEGKTTVSVGLADGLRRAGERVAVCLREPSLGPVFGAKGGGTGGGRAQVVPADDINLHFTGDLHAVTSAHNLLAALVDHDLRAGAPSGLAPERVTWPRVLDVDDRALRSVIVDAGGKAPRPTRFDITAASEVMAMLALAESLEDLRARLARTVVGFRDDGAAVRVADLEATDAMLALLREALWPNLVQTLEGTPALVHTGPFANIAHGCSSVVATQLALRHADLVVTEAGFGFDLGGEKFLHLVCPHARLWPRCVVLVATVRALTAHGGGDLACGLAHLDRQLDNVRAFGLPPLVAVNVFAGDGEDALARLERHCEGAGVPVARCTAFAEGGAGGEALAARVLEVLDQGSTPEPRALYAAGDPFHDKLRAVATTLYGAEDVALSDAARCDLDALSGAGFGDLPVCVAKTHLSFSDDPKAGGLARGFTPTVEAVRLAAGAGFLVALMGRVVTMPGLPRDPAAKHVRVDPDGTVHGLMQGN